MADAPAAPTPVDVVSPSPIPVSITDDPRGAARATVRAPDKLIQRQSSDPSVPARTTFQEDLTTAGQRRVNLIWEYTQAAIAILVVVATMVAGLYSMVQPTVAIGTGAAMVQVPMQIPSAIGIAFGMVTGFYFSRTNHAAIGGIGAKAQAEYVGR